MVYSPWSILLDDSMSKWVVPKPIIAVVRPLIKKDNISSSSKGDVMKCLLGKLQSFPTVDNSHSMIRKTLLLFLECDRVLHPMQIVIDMKTSKQTLLLYLLTSLF